MIYSSTVNHQKLQFSDPTHPPIWWRNTWTVPYKAALPKLHTHFENMVEDPSVQCSVKVIFKTIKMWFEKQETQIFFMRYYLMKMSHCACVSSCSSFEMLTSWAEFLSWTSINCSWNTCKMKETNEFLTLKFADTLSEVSCFIQWNFDQNSWKISKLSDTSSKFRWQKMK